MSTTDKLLRAFEALKGYYEGTSGDEQKKKEVLTTKERSIYCSSVPDLISSPNIRNLPEFGKLISIAIEILLIACDDSESDVRMIADEALNKSIKILMDINISRIHIELYKEIKKNGTSRSLRAALWRFADLCHLIRPQKCRTFALNVLPRIVRISKRQDDSVQETVASSMQKICPVFGKFINDSEVKILIRNLMINIKSSSASTRRTAASSITLLCRYSTKPNFFFAWLLKEILNLLLPLQNVYQQSHLLLGALSCLRSIIPYLSNPVKCIGSEGIHGTIGGIVIQNQDLSHVDVEHLIKMYGIVMACSKHSNHNIVTTALETLQLILKSPPKLLLSLLLADPEDRLMPSIAHIGSHRDISTNSSALDLKEIEARVGAMEMSAVAQSPNDFKMDISSSSLLRAEDNEVSDGLNLQDNESVDSVGIQFAIGDADAKINSEDATIAKEMQTGDKQLETGEEDEHDDAESYRSQFDSNISRIWDRLVDSNRSPILSCIRMLCTSFLLDGDNGQLISDKAVRVSVKVLALHCVSQALGLCPQAFLAPLYAQQSRIQDARDCSSQITSKADCLRVHDVLQFTSHSDPKLRGNIALLSSSYIKASLIVAGYHYDLWLHSLSQQIKDEEVIHLESLVNMLLALLKDESSVVVGMALQAVKLCITSLMKSDESYLSWNIIATVLQLNINPYWLVRVKLLDIITELDFVLMEYWRINNENTDLFKSYCTPCTQQQVLEEIVMKLLGDEDARVRQAATTTLVAIIPRLFYLIDHPKNDYLIAAAHQSLHVISIHDTENDISKDLALLTKGSAITKANDRRNYVNDITLANLSRIIDSMLAKLHLTTSKHFMIGCLHALFVLSEEFSVHKYSPAWGYHQSRASEGTPVTVTRQNSFGSLDDISGSNGSGPLPLILSLMTSSWVTYDLQAHADVLGLACNLLVGAAFNSILNSNSTNEKFDVSENWPSLNDFLLVPLANQLFTHIARLLNIFTFIIDDLPTTVPQTQKAKEFLREKSGSLPGLAGSASTGALGAVMSPKKKFSFRSRGGDPVATPVDRSNTSVGELGDYGPKVGRVSDSGSIGQFVNIPHYFKLYEELKSVQASYQASLSKNEAEDKFTSLLRTTLNSFAKILEITTLNEIGRFVEEFINYMQACIKKESASTLRCVQQFIRCMFSINASTNPWHIPINISRNRYTNKAGNSAFVGFYQVFFELPLQQFAIKLTRKKDGYEDIELDDLPSTARSTARIPASESGGRADNKRPVQLIRFFEPLVIRALKMYTFTSSVELQQQILHMLAQLIKIRINYSLLDADQAFVNFILRQIELIEAGQLKESEKLIPSIFQFLILLSYERVNFDPIVNIPRILQLSDGIMASGQLAPAHVIPAFRPIVFDLFNVRKLFKPKGEEAKQLDAQREVVIATLMKLMNRFETIELCLAVLSSCREEEERWKRVSRQMVDFLLPLLVKLQINVDSIHALHVLHRFFENVMPISLRPIDMLLKAFFTPLDMENDVKVHRWLAMILVVFQTFLLRSDEDTILTRLQELRIDSSLFLKGWNSECEEDCSSIITFTNFVFYVIKCVTQNLCESIGTPTNDRHMCEFLGAELNRFFLYLKYVIKNQVYKKFAKQAKSLVKHFQSGSKHIVNQINTNIQGLRQTFPRIVLDWWDLLLQLEFTRKDWWEQSLLEISTVSNTTTAKIPGCSEEIIRRGAMLLFCNGLSCFLRLESFEDLRPWFVSLYAIEIVNLCSEPPVLNLLTIINNEADLCGVFLRGIDSSINTIKPKELKKPSFSRKLVRCFSGIHDNYTGCLIRLIITSLLDTHHRCVGRLFETLCCNRLEMLLTETAQGCMQQLSDGVADVLDHFLQNSSKSNRYLRMRSLIIRVLNHADMKPQESHQLSRQLSQHRFFPITKDWFLDVIKRQCFRENNYSTASRNCSLLLRSLPIADAKDLLNSKEFDISLLEDCLLVSLNSIRSSHSLREPVNDNNSTESPKPGELYLECQQVLMNRISTLLEDVLSRNAGKEENVQASPASDDRNGQNLYKFNAVADYNTLVHATERKKSVFYLTKCLTVTLESEVDLSSNYRVPETFCEAAARFALFSLGISCRIVTELNSSCHEELHAALTCTSVALFSRKYVRIYSSPCYTEVVCQAIKSLYSLIVCIGLSPGSVLVPPSICVNNYRDLVANDEDLMILHACSKVSQLLHGLRTVFGQKSNRRSDIQISQFLVGPFVSVVLGLARLPLFNGYSCIPLLAWKMGWMAGNKFSPSKPIPPISPDLLVEKEILEDFVFRINLLGWTSRQQFEEFWVALLGVLGTAISEGASNDEISEINLSNCIAVEGLSSLLLQTSLIPIAGRPNRCIYLHTPRHKPLPFMNTSVGQKLKRVRGLVEKSIEKFSVGRATSYGSLPVNYNHNMGCIRSTITGMSKKSHFWLRSNHLCEKFLYNNNIDRDLCCLDYGFGQVPVSVLRMQVSETDKKNDDYSRATMSEEDIGLDIHSCLQFLLELFERWLMPSQSSQDITINLKREAAKAVMILSDVFVNREHFQWMYDIFMELYKIHPVEDEIMMQYVVIGICKAVSVLGLDEQSADKICRVIEFSLKSSYLSLQICGLYGALYLLEPHPMISLVLFLEPLMDYLTTKLSEIQLSSFSTSYQHTLVLLSTAFFIIEHYVDDVKDTHFFQQVLHAAMTMISASDEVTPSAIYHAVIRALERIVLSFSLTPEESDLIVKLSIDRLSMPSPERGLSALGLLLTCMYAGKVESEVSQSQEMDAMANVHTIEKVTILFDRIRKGLPSEATVVARILPAVLEDFFSPQEIMNKVIGEFLSNQQPHPQLMAEVLFRVFENLQKRSQQNAVTKWIMLSIGSFTQRTPLAMAVWGLNCLLISASTDYWIRSLLPYVIGRIGKLEYIDKQIFYITALDFFVNKNLDQTQKRSFLSTFASSVSPYSDLTRYCQQYTSDSA